MRMEKFLELQNQRPPLRKRQTEPGRSRETQKQGNPGQLLIELVLQKVGPHRLKSGRQCDLSVIIYLSVRGVQPSSGLLFSPSWTLQHALVENTSPITGSRKFIYGLC